MDKIAKWGFIATVISVIIGALALFRDVTDYQVQIKPDESNPQTTTLTKQIDEDKSQYKPNEDNNQSCTFELLKGVEDSSEVELCVKLESKYSESFTNKLKQELETKIVKFMPNKSITFSLFRNDKSKINKKRYYYLIGDFNITFKSTNEIAPEIGQHNLITGSSSGDFNLSQGSAKNRISDCQIFLNLAGTEKKEIINNLITSIFRNI